MRKGSKTQRGPAVGGIVDPGSVYLVGEPGPEVLYLPKGAQVAPTPPSDIMCACGETLAHADGAALVLHVWERSILRPHVLRPLDLPLTWNCPRCGVQTIIPAR